MKCENCGKEFVDGPNGLDWNIVHGSNILVCNHCFEEVTMKTCLNCGVSFAGVDKKPTNCIEDFCPRCEAEYVSDMEETFKEECLKCGKQDRLTGGLCAACEDRTIGQER
jgi:hypothetical protein